MHILPVTPVCGVVTLHIQRCAHILHSSRISVWTRPVLGSVVKHFVVGAYELVGFYVENIFNIVLTDNALPLMAVFCDLYHRPTPY